MLFIPKYSHTCFCFLLQFKHLHQNIIGKFMSAVSVKKVGDYSNCSIWCFQQRIRLGRSKIWSSNPVGPCLSDKREKGLNLDARCHCVVSCFTMEPCREPYKQTLQPSLKYLHIQTHDPNQCSLQIIPPTVISYQGRGCTGHSLWNREGGRCCFSETVASGGPGQLHQAVESQALVNPSTNGVQASAGITSW